MNKHFNIMSSSNNNLVSYITIQLYSISNNLNDSIIDFYLFHRDISPQNLDLLDSLCKNLNNIHFHSVIVPEPEKYDILAKHGGGWVGEAYFSLCAHLLLPDSVSRVLYIDAGDVIILDDIMPYYNCDFNDKALIVTAARYKLCNNEPVSYEETDIDDLNEGFPSICRGIFNSGSYVMNLNKIRAAQLTIDDFLDFAQILCNHSGKKDTSKIYWGDQGFLSAAFVGDVKIFNYPHIRNLWYMPYNFCLWYYHSIQESPPYQPAIVHFAVAIKIYPIPLERFDSKATHTMSELKMGQAEWYYLWHEYAICTDKILNELGY